MPPETSDSQLRDLYYRVRVLTRYRLYALMGFGLMCAFFRFAVGVTLSGNIPLFGAAYALETWLFSRWACRQRSPEGVERIIMLGYLADLLLVTWMALRVGIVQPLAPLYFSFVVVYGSLMLAPVRSLLMALVASCLYCGTLRYLAARGPLGGAAAEFHDIWVLRYAISGTVFLLSVSAILSFFAELLRRKHTQVERANRRLRATAQQLRQHKEHLERTVEERTQDVQEAYRRLKVANDELRRADQLKTQLLANVSHEFRTPLTSIRSFSEILLDYQDQDAASRQEFLTIIISECDRLSRLIDNLLDLSRIESGHTRWEFRRLDLREVTWDTVSKLAPLAEAKGLALCVAGGDQPLPVLADPDRMVQVITNLLGNAIKFTTQGAITIHLETDQGNARLVVSDSGRGVPGAELARLFDKFYQVSEGLSDKPVGSGLGLAICREIVCHHGGRIWAEHNHPQGLRVICQLPLATQSGELLPVSPAEAEALAAQPGGEGGGA